MALRKILFIDRDGTLITEPQPSLQVDAYDKLSFLPHVITALADVVATADYELVMVTNQDGLGTNSFPEADFWPVHNLMVEVLASQGITFRATHIDRTFGNAPGPGRKPALGMLHDYVNATDIDWANSWVIGDRLTDVQLAQNLGCGHAAWLGAPEEVDARVHDTSWLEQTTINPNNPSLKLEQIHLLSDWRQLADLLILPQRSITWKRHTHETQVDISLTLDGSGLSKVSTGLGFFDHMLDQIARHGGLDMTLTTKGDLHIDEHHTIEDTGIALGEALRHALGNKQGIQRYAFVLAMDDAQANVALDFGGRAWVVWDAKFSRDRVGDMPTEMVYHFFKSLADAAACNLQVSVSGDNDHHKIEAIFKGFARCIRQAAARDRYRLAALPSTKGML